MATSGIAVVEVSRASALANPSEEVREEIDKLLASCMLVAVSAQLLRSARKLAAAGGHGLQLASPRSDGSS